ncbi:ribosomal protein S18-alanine N-acetyltransferase [Psychrobacter sp.]|uniref:ribosomal protein S18-alanine N-acetyltransferase n=1 Tax=unclassified Psychrobacter TaxID=196806 RepID=UPI003F962F91
MFTTKILGSESDDHAEVIKAVAMIEAIVQLQEPWNEKTLNDLLAQDSISLMVVSTIGSDETVGYCLYQVIFEQAEILRIATHPNNQRQGVASQIFANLNTVLMNNQVESLLLEVRADNMPAIALYEQQGFAVIHKRKGYYQQSHQPAIDALIMQHVYH